MPSVLAIPYRHEVVVDQLPRSEVGWRKWSLHRIRRTVIHRCLVGETPRDVARYFIDEVGWPGHPYHFQVWLEPGQGITVSQTAALNEVTNGVAGANTTSVHVMVEGDFRKAVPVDDLFYGAACLAADLRGFGCGGRVVRGHSETTLWLPKKYQTMKKCPGAGFDMVALRRVVERISMGNETGLPVLPVGKAWWS